MNATERFERERPRLLKIAYSMLGRLSEATGGVPEMEWC